MFYTQNGLPIDADPAWDYEHRYELDTATEADKYYIKPTYITAKLHFDREPRFYANLGFDGGIWFGQGNFDQDQAWHVEGRSEEHTSELQSLMRISYAVFCLKKKKINH